MRWLALAAGATCALVWHASRQQDRVIREMFAGWGRIAEAQQPHCNCGHSWSKHSHILADFPCLFCACSFWADSGRRRANH